MLDSETKRRIDTARDILVGKVPDPKSQVEQITIALIYKFMDDMDKEAVSFGGAPTFFAPAVKTGNKEIDDKQIDFSKYAWSKVFDPRLGGHDMLKLYSEAITNLNVNPNVPQLFRDIFKNAYLPYRDPETLKLFLKTINEFHYDHSEKLGDAFEYLLSVLGSQGDAGQFRTPRHIIDFMVEILQPKKNERIADPACGTSGFLISAYKHILQQNTVKQKGDLLTPDDRNCMMQNFVGYDISPDMVRLSLVNMYLHGFSTPHITEYDTLTSKDRWNENFDLILANPPFMTPKGGVKPHKLFSIQSNRTEVLFLDYILEHINPIHGRAAVIIPEGIMYTQKSAHTQLRKLMINSDWLYAVATLPSGIFKPYASVKTNILFIDKRLSKKAKAVLFVDIFNDGFTLSDTRKPIALNDLPVALQIISRYRDSLINNKTFALEKGEENYGYVVTKNRINKPSYHLIGRWYKIDETYKGAKYPLKRLGDLCDIKQGLSPNMKTKPGKYPLVVPAPNRKTADHYDFEGNATCIPLVSSSGHGKADIKRLHYEAGKFALANTMAALFSKNEKVLNTKYLYEVLTHRKDKILVPLMKGAANVTMEPDDLFDVLIPVPPLEIQLAIVYRNNYENIIAGAKLVVESFTKDLLHNGSVKIIEENKTLIKKFEKILHTTETVKEVWGE